MNVISAMMEIAANPVTADGKDTTPITYDSNCLEEICGSCAMRINGKARMACSALVDNLEQPIKVEPLSKFPLVRDLQVDRSVLFENLKAVKAWVPIDGTYDLGSGRGSSRSSRRRAIAFELHQLLLLHGSLPAVQRCNGICGAATIAQVKLFNDNPSGKVYKEERLRALAGDGGIQEWRVCAELRGGVPEGDPLTNAISDVSRDVLVQMAKDFLRGNSGCGFQAARVQPHGYHFGVLFDDH